MDRAPIRTENAMRRKPEARMWIDPIRYAWERCHQVPMPESINNFVFDLRALAMTRNYGR